MVERLKKMTGKRHKIGLKLILKPRWYRIFLIKNLQKMVSFSMNEK